MLLFFKFLNEHLDTKLIVEAVSRDPKLFLKENPEFITCDWIIWNKSDIRSFSPVLDRIDFIIHGATTSANETFQGTPSLEKFSVTFQGTLQVLKTIDKFQPEKFLFISSGSVYNSKTLERINYPKNSKKQGQYYLVYKVAEVRDEEFLNLNWDITKLDGYKKGRGSALPFSATMTELMKTKKK
jgi:UDP-glucose 4-epimerase